MATLAIFFAVWAVTLTVVLAFVLVWLLKLSEKLRSRERITKHCIGVSDHWYGECHKLRNKYHELKKKHRDFLIKTDEKVTKLIRQQEIEEVSSQPVGYQITSRAFKHTYIKDAGWMPDYIGDLDLTTKQSAQDVFKNRGRVSVQPIYLGEDVSKEFLDDCHLKHHNNK